MKFLLVAHIKVCKSNFFFIVSDGLGKTLLNINSGYLGFNNIKKRTTEALNKVLFFGFDFLSKYTENYYLFLKFENIKKRELRKLYKVCLKKLKLTFFGFRVVNKLPHNGCKK